MLTSPVQVQDDIEQYLALYEQMLKIRTFEDQVNTLYQTGLMPGLAHQYSGQEAVAVGVCDALERTDYITSTHRGHGHCGGQNIVVLDVRKFVGNHALKFNSIHHAQKTRSSRERGVLRIAAGSKSVGRRIVDYVQARFR